MRILFFSAILDSDSDSNSNSPPYPPLHLLHLLTYKQARTLHSLDSTPKLYSMHNSESLKFSIRSTTERRRKRRETLLSSMAYYKTLEDALPMSNHVLCVCVCAKKMSGGMSRQSRISFFSPHVINIFSLEMEMEWKFSQRYFQTSKIYLRRETEFEFAVPRKVFILQTF